ncbi:UDP-N-acetylmuramoyl-tripeptide--D-alanyl-D-alanine ligase [Coriobacteriia bacterium Es71-Z0120]|uniref:UDP-N-acetylmuramoyl-tripeptide--D-alanyl-D- alanine ligase n=1 Tax=Parvivirga hydrogeniphila TaxID=2939460 RepID=UPI002260AD9F|nr:UDP-N-acetylmuramoyl-tripeptide--D-alanyl-D-alanine ligase [Parvivirga hydrogeniphila]MCL4079109.1 UDP-N-acetylmuramoyl-tripeptide--D-alanyl-D-alanine ligase [Parvivirga hydrogeniphila]
MLRASIERVLEVTGGALVAGDASAMTNGLALDSRKVEPGNVFIALAGEHADGHDFVRAAIDAGARAVIVTRAEESVLQQIADSRDPDAAVVLVDDAVKAVQALAAYHRSRLICPVIGVTGSTGKTTTKDFLRAALQARFKVVASEGNRNNELGVPLTIFEAGADTGVLVVEMAMRGSGQIAELAAIARPTHGLVTNVGLSHVGVLGSQEAIADAKGELVEAIPETGAVFLNGDDAWTERLAAKSRARVVRYGLSESCDVRAEDISTAEGGFPVFTLVTGEERAAVTLPVLGKHNVYNALAAAAVALDLGVEAERIVDGLAGANMSGMRMDVFESASGVTVINDAYNANPVSMRAAIAALTDVRAPGRRVAVLGDMAELGSLAELAHFQLGEEVARSRIDVLVTVGSLARRIAEGARAEGMDPDSIRPCATPEEASEVLDDLLEPGDAVLVKASRVMGLERVVEGITEPHV